MIAADNGNTSQTDSPKPEPDNGLDLPPSLDRGDGKSRQEIDTEREAIIKRERNPDGSRRIANPLSRQEARQRRLDGRSEEEKTRSKVRVERMLAQRSGAAKAMPLSGKAAEQAIRAASGNSRPRAQKTKQAKSPAMPRKGESKIEMIARLLKRKEGCTTAEVLAATQWPSVSMPQQAKAAGLRLTKEKDGRVTRYHAEEESHD